MALLSSAVAATDLATAAQYNNLRTDAITHTHDGTDTPVVAMLNAKYITAQNASAVVKNILGVDASNVLALGASGLTLSLVNNTATLTLPTATDTILGRATTDTLTNKTLTSPRVGTAINDTGGNPLIVVSATGSAVNGLSVVNAATGNPPELKPGGPSADANTDLKLSPIGTGQIQVNGGTYSNIQTYSPSAAGTATLDLSKGDIHHITMPAGNITIAISNAKAGQCFLVRILQDSGGSRTVTWFTTIKWAGGSAPTLTTTANKADSFGFEVTALGSPNSYDGIAVGQNF